MAATAQDMTYYSICEEYELGQYQRLICEVLESKGYSLARVAQELGISIATLGRIYSGQTRCPRPALASKIYRLHVYARPDLWGIGTGWKIRLTVAD